MKDIRVLCQRCINDYRDAGYRIYIMRKPKDRCDKCGRIGFVCELKRGDGRGSYGQNRNILQ